MARDARVAFVDVGDATGALQIPPDVAAQIYQGTCA
jgi:hypothetical protein